MGKDSMQHSVTYLLVTLQCFTGIIWLGLLRLNHLLLRTRSITDDVLQRENYSLLCSGWTSTPVWVIQWMWDQLGHRCLLLQVLQTAADSKCWGNWSVLQSKSFTTKYSIWAPPSTLQRPENNNNNGNVNDMTTSVICHKYTDYSRVPEIMLGSYSWKPSRLLLPRRHF